MASPVFERVAAELIAITALDPLVARGTLRLALKDGGFDAERVNAAQLRTVVLRILPGHLAARGVETAAASCDRLVRCLGAPDAGETDEVDAAAAVFERFARGR